MQTSKPSSRGTGRSRPGEIAPVPSLACPAPWTAAGTALFLACALATATAQSLPLEIRQDAIRYNLSSTNGLPISSTRNVPPGSDGRAPTVAQQQAAGLTEVPATANQFRGLTFFGAVALPGTTNLNPALSLGANAESLNLPRIKVNNLVVMSMTRARIGAPMLGRAVSFLFGEIVPRPGADEFGVLLSVVNTNVNPNRPAQSPETYWLPEADLVLLGNGVSVNRGCVLQTHLFHDRVMRLGTVDLDHGATMGPHSVILPAASIGADATVGPSSLVMRGEHVPAGTRWAGNPIAPWLDDDQREVP
jgi:hypothetical protein